MSLSFNNKVIPSFEELFGNQDFNSSDEYRTVLSPAAYLVDLLMLKDVQMGTNTDQDAYPIGDIEIRPEGSDDDNVQDRISRFRKDIYNIRLNRANTITEIPYLDIVNKVLEDKVMLDLAVDDPYKTLSNTVYPFTLPKNIHQQKNKITLDYFKTDMVTMFKRFGQTDGVDKDFWLCVAKEYLKISQNELTILTSTDVSPEYLKTVWGLDPASDLIDELSKVEVFKKKAKLNNAKLQELIYQNLSSEEKEDNKQSNFFINSPDTDRCIFVYKDLSGGSIDEQYLLKLSSDTPIDLTYNHFDLIQKIIRLSKITGWSITDCDFVLKSCCNNNLNAKAIKIIAAIKYLQDIHGLSVNETCALVTDIKTYGEGIQSEDSEPLDHFYQIFGFKYIDPESDSSDPVDPQKRKYQLKAALGVSEKEYETLITLLKSVYDNLPDDLPDSVVNYSLKDLSFLYRLSKLAKILKVKIADLSRIIEIFDLNRKVNELEAFDLLINFYLDPEIVVPDTGKFKVIKSSVNILYDNENEIYPPLNLVQSLTGLIKWLENHEISVDQFEFICRRDVDRAVEDTLSNKDLISVFKSIFSDYSTIKFSANSLVSSYVNLDMSENLFAEFTKARFNICNENGIIKTDFNDARSIFLHDVLLDLSDFKRLFDSPDADKATLNEKESSFLNERLLSAALTNLVVFIDGKFVLYQEGMEVENSDFHQRIDNIDFFKVSGEYNSDSQPFLDLINPQLFIPEFDHNDMTEEQIANKINEDRKILGEKLKLVYAVLLGKVKGYEDLIHSVESTEENQAVDLVKKVVQENIRKQRQLVKVSLGSELGIPDETCIILIDHIFRNPDESTVMGVHNLLAPIVAFYSLPDTESLYPDLGCLHVAFRRLQQFVLLIKKAKLTTLEVKVFMEKMRFSENMPENLKLPDSFLDSVTASYTELSGDIIIFAKILVSSSPEEYEIQYAKYSKSEHELLETGLLSDYFSGMSISFDSIDAAVTDVKKVSDNEQIKKTYIFNGEKVISVDKTGVPVSNQILGNWGTVRNNIQTNDKVDAAYATDMSIYLFSGDQYYRYTKVDNGNGNYQYYLNDYVDEGYPLRINKHWNDQESGEFQFNSDLIRKIDGIFKGTDDIRYIFTNDKYLPVGVGDQNILLDSREMWGTVRNNFQQENPKISAALITPDYTYLFCGDQYIRYDKPLSPGDDEFFVDEEYPRLISEWNAHETVCQLHPSFFDISVPPMDVEAAFTGVNDKVYFFKGENYYYEAGVSSTPSVDAINSKWGKVRNNIQENGVVDSAVMPLPKNRYYLGVESSSINNEKIVPIDKSGIDWIEDVSTLLNEPITMNGTRYMRGIGGKPPLTINVYNWMLFDVKDAMDQLCINGEATRLVGFGGHQDGSGSVDLFIRTSIDDRRPSDTDWTEIRNGVTERWSCSYLKNNCPIDIDLRHVKWIWIAMKTGSSDPNDHGVFANLELVIDRELQIPELLLGINESSTDRALPDNRKGSIWVEDKSTRNEQSITMNGRVFEKGIGGKPPLNTGEYNWLLYNVDEILNNFDIVPRKQRDENVSQGVIYREYWLNINGSNVTDLTSNPDFPHKPSGRTIHTLFEAPSNTGDNYGTRMYGYLIPPESGYYKFWIASDDNSQLWLSNNENPANKQMIAYVNGYCSPREWNKFPSQQSVDIYLEEGREYFVEAIHKEGSQYDNLAVGWQLPNGTTECPIPGNRFEKNYKPAMILYGYGGHQDGSGSVDLVIKTSNNLARPSENEWINNQNGVTLRWNCSYTENDKRILIDLDNVKWIWLGMNTGSSDINDHGIFANLKMAVEREKADLSYPLAITGIGSDGKMIPVNIEGANWINDRSTKDNAPITMNGHMYATGIGGKPPLITGNYNWVLYDIRSFLKEMGINGNALLLTGRGGHQDGSGSVDLFIRTSTCIKCPDINDWLSNGKGVSQKWYCEYTENNKYIYINLENVNWIWLGMSTGSSDINDHGVFADLKLYVKRDQRELDTYLFSGDQYFKYDYSRFEELVKSSEPFYLMESYPKVLQNNWNAIENLGTLPPALNGGIQASFMGADNKLYLFGNNQYVDLYTPGTSAPINHAWGIVKNKFQKPGAVVDAIIHKPGTNPVSYLFSGCEYVRYTGEDTTYCDEGYPKLISNWRTAEGAAQDFPSDYYLYGIQAALYGNNGKQYYFRNNTFVSSDNYNQVRNLENEWHTQVNPSVNFNHVDFSITVGTFTFLFAGDYYLKYEGTINPGNSSFYPKSGYPKRVLDDWNSEGTGIDLGAYNTRKTMALGYFREGADVKLFFCVGESYQQLTPGLPAPASVLNRLRLGKRPNAIQDFNRVDAAVTIRHCSNYVTYLICGSQYVRYTHSIWSSIREYRYIDEGYPRAFNPANWDLENNGIELRSFNAAANGYAVLTDADDITYHFDGDQFIISGESSLPIQIKPEWGLVYNLIQMENRVDSAFVFSDGDNRYAYIFRRNQYVSYSYENSDTGYDYEYVDEGYPKIITPEKWSSFESHLTRSVWPQDLELSEGIHAAMFKDGALYFFGHFESENYSGNGYKDIFDVDVAEAKTNNHWGIVHNLFKETGRITAAVLVNDGVNLITYLFCGYHFVRYTHSIGSLPGVYGYVDGSYPRTIKTKLYREFNGIDQMDFQPQEIEAAFSENDHKKITFFNLQTVEPQARNYVKIVSDGAATPVYRINKGIIKERWGYVFNQIEGDILNWKTSSDAVRPEKSGLVETAVRLSDGRLAIFTENQFAVYSNGKSEYVDESFPRRIYNQLPPSLEIYPGDPLDIKGNYWGFPSGFGDNGIEAAMSLCGRVYFFARYTPDGGETGLYYVRYSDQLVKFYDTGFPKKLAERWRNIPEISVNDLNPFWDMKNLTLAFNQRENDILTFLNEELTFSEQIQSLVKVTEWPENQITFVRDTFLINDYFVINHEDLQDVLTLFAMKRYFDYSQKLSTLPQQLYNEITSKLFSPEYSNPNYYDNYKAATELLYELLHSSQSKEVWQKLSGEFNNDLNLIKRDSLVDFLIAHLINNTNYGIENARDLYQYFLVDVEMGKEATTSKIQEALACLQLYYQRVLMQLENETDTFPDYHVESKLKKWWFWMKNYRVWEANRKVFLYPENYLRPELRRDKSQAFKALEEALKQNDMNDEAIENSFREYLDEYAVVSTLDIVGGYVYLLDENNEQQEEDPDNINENTNVIMFGHTRTKPLKYYYRKAYMEYQNQERLSINWEPWEAIKININADTVYPVYAFNRIFVFWLENQEVEYNENPESDKKIVKIEPVIYYSFLKMNGEWVSPQEFVNVYKDTKSSEFVLLDPTDTQIETIYNVKLQVSNPLATQRYDGDEKIVVKYSLKSNYEWTWVLDNKFQINKTTTKYIINNLKPDLSRIFEENQNDVKQINHWKSNLIAVTSAPWFSLFIKGGSFLLKPGTLPTVSPDAYKGIKEKYTDSVITEISSAMKGLNDKVYLFSGNNYYTSDNYSVSIPVLQTFGSMENFFNSRTLLNISIAELNGTECILFYLLDGSNVYCFTHVYDTNYSNQLENFTGQSQLLQIESTSSNTAPDKSSDGLLSEIMGSRALWTGDKNEFFNSRATSIYKHVKPYSGGGQTTIDFYYLTNNDYYIGLTEGELINLLPSSIRDSLSSQNLRAVYKSDNMAYTLVFGNQYVICNLTGNPNSITGPHPISNLVQSDSDFTTITGAFSGNDGVDYFFNNGICKYNNGAWIKESISEKWGTPNLIASNFNENSRTIDAAFTRDSSTYLFIGNQFIEYTQSMSNPFTYEVMLSNNDLKKLNGSIFNDLKDLLTESGMSSFNSMFISSKISEMTEETSEERLYVIAGNYYASYKFLGGTFIEVTKPSLIIDSMGNLLYDFCQTIDAAVNIIDAGQESLTLFKNSRNEQDEPVCKIVTYDSSEDTVLKFPYEFRNLKFEIIRLTSNTAIQLSQILFAYGVDKLLTIDTQLSRELPAFALEDQAIDQVKRADIVWVKNDGLVDTSKLPSNEKILDFDSANKEYYWEIFFHIPFLIAQELNTLQKFEAAQKWFEFVFDPTDPEMLESTPVDEDPWWRFIQFKENYFASNEEGMFYDLRNATQIFKYKNDPLDPHAIADLRKTAYRKATVMAYIDNLIDWGDMLFGLYTRESINEARMLYVLAYDILGKRPENLGAQTVPDSATYKQITNAGLSVPIPEDESYYYTHSDFLIEFENNASPNYTEWSDPHDTIIASDLYFAIPENQNFIQYWDRVEDRLYKIKATLNINGEKQALPLFQPPIDPFLLISALASGLDLSSVLADLVVSAPHYRFSFMLNKAKELASRLTQLGSTFLSTLEKKDAEALNLLRNTHEKNILALNLEIKEDQIKERRESLGSLTKSLASANTRLTHYTELVNNGLNVFEKSQLVNLTIGQAFQMVSQILSTVQGVLSTVPQAGSPFAMTYGGIQLSGAMQGASGAMGAYAGFYNFLANMNSIMAGHERRSEEWKLQKKLASFDVKQIEHQIEAAKLQIKIAQMEIDIQKKLIRQNESIDEFMRNKFSNEELYKWMVTKLSKVYFQTYQMAHDYAKAAQKAMQFELGEEEKNVNFIGGVYWDSLKKGLMSGESLLLDLDRLEKAYIDRNTRTFELTKTVSLFQIDPTQLVRFKTEYSCEFSMSQQLFDEDFPGHYCRQIKSITVTFPAVVGPYQNINATLTQVNHKTHIRPDEATLDKMYESEVDSTGSVRYDWRANQQVALSRGVNDSGLFQLQFQDERYLPFEGTGAVSSWRLELEGISGKIDISTLADVLITVNYTSKQGGERLAKKAKSLIKENPNKSVLFNLARSFPNEWNHFLTDNGNDLTITITKDMLYNPDTMTSALIFYDLTESGKSLNSTGLELQINDEEEPVPMNTMVVTSFESDISIGKEIKLTFKTGDTTGDDNPDAFTPDKIRNIGLVLGYTCKHKFNK